MFPPKNLRMARFFPVVRNGIINSLYLFILAAQAARPKVGSLADYNPLGEPDRGGPVPQYQPPQQQQQQQQQPQAPPPQQQPPGWYSI